MKLAIHHRQGSFSERWISYCESRGIEYKIVNCFEDDIMTQLQGCDALLWHHHHGHFKDTLIAKNILYTLEHSGINVFPDFKTGWHFDNKVAQKYLLERIGAPLASISVFYEKEAALKWLKNTSFPKVFKLKGGAGSANVLLIRNYKKGKKLINKAFGKGFSQYTLRNAIKDDWIRFKTTGKFINLLKAVGRTVYKPHFAKMQAREKGYVYFQDFMPNNTYDTRIIVIGKRAFGIKRIVRDNDFRASGSGKIIYDREEIDINCIRVAFKVNERIKSQSIAYDFIYDTGGKPVIVEISYGFTMAVYDDCPGYWDSELNWHASNIKPQEWIIEDLLEDFKQKMKI